MADEQSVAQESIWRTVREFNEACVRGAGFEALTPVTDENVIFIPPGFGGRIQGREKLLAMYAEACSGMKVHEMRASEEQIDIFGGAAVVSYRYDTVWEARGRRNTQEGREILVFTKAGEDWKLCWRALQPARRETQPSASETSGAQGEPTNLHGECLALMSRSRACFLTTIDAEGFPQTTGMDNLRNAEFFPSLVPLFAAHRDDFLVYLSTFLFSRKVTRIIGNGNSCVYFYDPDAAVGLMLVGRVEVVEDRELKDRIWQEGWTVYYPSGPDGPEYGVLSFRPHLARGWGASGPYEFTLPLSGKDSI